MDRCPKDESTVKIYFAKKALPIPEKNWKNLLGEWHLPPPPVAIGGLNETESNSAGKKAQCLHLAANQKGMFASRTELVKKPNNFSNFKPV